MVFMIFDAGVESWAWVKGDKEESRRFEVNGGAALERLWSGARRCDAWGLSLSLEGFEF